MLYIKDIIESELVIEKSKFITHIYPVSNLDDVTMHLNEIRKIHRDANHNCYAYIIQSGKEVKASDDGEPSKTAGVPILEVLKHHDLTDVLCVVTRYFGGIKLGAGGLIRAYSNSTSSALKSAIFLKKELRLMVLIDMPYPLYDTFLYQMKHHLDIKDQQFGETIQLTCILNDLSIADVKEKFHSVTITNLGETLVSIELE